MKYYAQMLEMGSFDRKAIIELTGSDGAARSIIYDYLKNGYIERVRRDYYVAISLETRQPVLNRYQLACQMFDDAYLTHHSAFEAYGFANQTYYMVYVATDRKFDEFEYDGVFYHRIEKKANAEIVSDGGIRLTSIEQTVVDSIKDYEKIAGLEEVLRCLELVTSLDEEKVLAALERYNNTFLYQKCGYIFEELNLNVGLTEKFFVECKKRVTGSKRYLIKNNSDQVLNNKWSLIVPKNLRSLIDKGVTYYDAI